MARKRLAAQQIVTKLRQIEVLQGQGKTIAMACKEARTTEQKLRDECLNGEIFYSLRSTGRHRAMAQSPQHQTSALGVGIQATSTSHNRTKANPLDGRLPMQ